MRTTQAPSSFSSCARVRSTRTPSSDDTVFNVPFEALTTSTGAAGWVDGPDACGEPSTFAGQQLHRARLITIGLPWAVDRTGDPAKHPNPQTR